MDKQTLLGIVKHSHDEDDRPTWLADMVRRPYSFRYYRAFVALARHMNPALIVELGTNTGAGALHFRHGAPTAKIVTVDITKTSPHRCKLIEQADIEYIIKDSVEAASQVDGKIDMIFYDANHEYSNVMAEVAAWMPKMKEGGIAFFDDIRYNVEVRPQGKSYVSTHNKLLEVGEETGMFRAWTEISEQHGKEAVEVKEMHPSTSFGVILF